MLPYSTGLMLDSSNNYGIVKTETLFGFGSNKDGGFVNDLNTTDPLQWILPLGNINQPLKESSRALQSSKFIPESKSEKKKKRKQTKKMHKHKSKGQKCIYKIYKRKNRKRKSHQKKYMMPMMIGLIAAKSILIPVALKALAFISAKGLMMGFFSTIMASLLSLKGMFDHSHGYQNRKDDTKTQVEIIQVPHHTDDHYYEDHYKRGDYMQVPKREMIVK